MRDLKPVYRGPEVFSPRKFLNLGLEIYLKLPRAVKFIIALQDKKNGLKFDTPHVFLSLQDLFSLPSTLHHPPLPPPHPGDK